MPNSTVLTSSDQGWCNFSALFVSVKCIFKKDLRDGMLGRMRHREVGRIRAELFEDLVRNAFDVNGRNTVRVVFDLDIVPSDRAPPAGF